MKKSLATVTLLALALVSGCTQGKPGGPGAAGDSPTVGQAENTFNLSVPLMSSSLKQGEQVDATIGIKRAKNFDEDVVLKFADLPKGVTVEPAEPTIKHGDKESKLFITAANEAQLGDFTIKVMGHPTQGGDAKVEFKITIAAKDSFTLSMPTLTTSLNQGEAQTIWIGIARQPSFNEPVTLTFGELPTGVTLKLNDAVIQPGDSEVQVTLTAADDAALGDFDIQVTGHPTKGADATNKLNLTVAQK